MGKVIDRSALEALYERLNRREFVHPDPLEFLYEYADVRDREIVALVASSLAYGRVAQILASVRTVLDRIGEPARFAKETSLEKARRALRGFKHRFARGEEVAALLYGAGRLIERHGTLEDAFLTGYDAAQETTLPALADFARRLREAGGPSGHLFPCPSTGSACKRLHLFMRWMVRRDAVDPGGWDRVSKAKLVVPLDTHMWSICRVLGFAERASGDGKAALEVTAAFRRLSPEDPVKYDFALTRLGIRRDCNREEFLRQFASAEVA